MKRPYLWEHSDRPIIVSFIGSITVDSHFSNKLRKELNAFCASHSPSCLTRGFLPEGRGGRLGSEYEDASKDPLRAVVMKSIFCLQPLGDTPTRKSLFDSILHGCIPVVFHPLTASAMYAWHWGELWKQVLIEIPVNIHDESKPALASDPIQYLIEYVSKSPHELAKKQKLLRNHAFELSYAGEDYKEGSSWPMDHRGRPVRDAYMITMNHVLGMSTGRLASRRSSKVEESWTDDAFKITSHPEELLP